MGNSNPGPNTVQIMQEGCCGNLGLMVSPDEAQVQFGAPMDSRLAGYITEQEYNAVIGECRKTLRADAKRSRLVCFAQAPCILAFLILLVVCLQLHKPEYMECIAANGQCSAGSSPETDECCNWWCCDPNGDPQDFTSECTAIERTDSMDCMCAKQGKKMKCKRTHIEGEEDLVPAENPWAVRLAMASGALMYANVVGLCLGWSIGQCNLKNKMKANFTPWTGKGLTCSYHPGSKHKRACIFVDIPSTAAAIAVGAGKQ